MITQLFIYFLMSSIYILSPDKSMQQNNIPFDSLYNLAVEYKDSLPDSSESLAKQALEYSREDGDYKAEANALMLLYDIYNSMNKGEDAKLNLTECITILEEQGDNELLPKAYLNLGDFYENIGNFEKAIEEYGKAQFIYNSIKDYKEETNSLNRIGVAYKYKGDYAQALEWHYKSLKLSDEYNYQLGRANALGNIANVNESLQKYDEALEIYSRILDIFSELKDEKKYANTLMNLGVIYFYLGDYDKSLDKFKTSLEISQRLDDKLVVTYTLNNIACTYEVLENYEETFNYFNKSLVVSREMDNNWSVANTLNNIATTNIRLGRQDSALNNVNEALEKAQIIGSKNLIADSYKILSNLYSNKRDYKKSLEYFRLYHETNDSLYNESSHRQIAEITTKYEMEKKEKDIQELLIKEQRRIIIFISSTLFLLIVIAIANYMKYRYKKKSERLLKTVIDSLTHPFCVFKVPGREVELVNTAAEKGNSPYKEFINNPALLFETKEIPYTFDYVLENKKPFSLDLQNNINGNKVFYEYFGFPIFDNRQNVTKIIEYAVDITDKKLAVDKIKSAFEREKELNDLKSQFISSTSHEFRTPLATLFSSVELIQHYDKTKSESKKLYHLARIKSIVKYMTTMLDDILTINKADMNKLDFQPALINLRDFCNEIMEDIVVLAYSQHYINVSIEGDYNKVILDTKLLRHILTNLLSNAIKYSPEGGQILFKTNVNENEVEFTIRDEGIGIPDSDLKNLFQHFFRASNVGTISGAGLGLAIVKKAVEVHGGTIEFSSGVGKGTTFIVKLPLQKEIHGAMINYS